VSSACVEAAGACPAKLEAPPSHLDRHDISPYASSRNTTPHASRLTVQEAAQSPVDEQLLHRQHGRQHEGPEHRRLDPAHRVPAQRTVAVLCGARVSALQVRARGPPQGCARLGQQWPAAVESAVAVLWWSPAHCSRHAAAPGDRDAELAEVEVGVPVAVPEPPLDLNDADHGAVWAGVRRARV
jgi:hypothetical protein